jgi:peptide/nickel transport system permease protein
MSSGSLLIYAARRLVALAILLLVLSVLIFALLFLAPGSAEQVLLGTQPASPQVIASLRAKYHLDDPFLQQYWIWLRGALQLDFGDSIRTGRSVLSSVGARAGVTLFLGLYAFVVSVVVGVSLGILAAVRKRGIIDRGVVALCVLGASAPAFVTGVFMLYVFAVTLGWFPSYGEGTGFGDRLWHLTLPAAALSLTAMALIVRLTRTAMITELEQDYVAFARARGVPGLRVIVRHALRNALVPIVTAGGLVLTVVLTGAVLVEVTFALPGLGTLLVGAVENKDVPMLQGVAMVFATVVVLVNLLVDVLYAVVDPRIRFERRSA